MNTVIKGSLEIDHERGVVYFHSDEIMYAPGSSTAVYVTVLRICRLPAPIPINKPLDITHMYGTDWSNATASDVTAVKERERAELKQQIIAEHEARMHRDV